MWTDARAAAIDALRAQITAVEQRGRAHAQAEALPFGIAAIDHRLPSGGLLIAAEDSQVLGLLIRRSRRFDDPVLAQPSAAMTRWRISALPSSPAVPGAVAERLQVHAVPAPPCEPLQQGVPRDRAPDRNPRSAHVGQQVAWTEPSGSSEPKRSSRSCSGDLSRPKRTGTAALRPAARVSIRRPRPRSWSRPSGSVPPTGTGAGHTVAAAVPVQHGAVTLEGWILDHDVRVAAVSGPKGEGCPDRGDRSSPARPGPDQHVKRTRRVRPRAGAGRVGLGHHRHVRRNQGDARPDDVAAAVAYGPACNGAAVCPQNGKVARIKRVRIVHSRRRLGDGSRGQQEHYDRHHSRKGARRSAENVMRSLHGVTAILLPGAACWRLVA